MSSEHNYDLKGGSSSSLRLGDEFRNTIVGGHYRIVKRLGSGSFGDIFLGEQVSNQVKVAIKLEPASDRAGGAQLFNEHKFYKILGEESGFPKIFWFGIWDRFNVLIMDLLGKTLEEAFEVCEHKFSLKTTIQVVLQLLNRFEYLHSKKIAYRDVKPENFLLGRVGTSKSNVIHVVDFGLSKEYIDPLTKRHISYREGKSLTGTARYMSINSHLGIEQSRRDDLEALGHMFVYFLRKGKLPWSGLKAPTLKERYKKIGEVKQKMPVAELCAGFPVEFPNYLIYTRQLQFEEDPNYEEMKKSFVNLFNEKGFEHDSKYDWDNKLE